MAGRRRVVELAMTCEEIERLTTLSRSRTERPFRHEPSRPAQRFPWSNKHSRPYRHRLLHRTGRSG